MKSAHPLRVLFVTPECAPWAKTGGLGDVSAGLPPALAGLGVEMRVLLPGYPSVLAHSRGTPPVALFDAEFGFPAGRLLQAELPSGVTALILDCPDLYQRPGGPYQDERGADHADNARRFGCLSRIAARLASGLAPVGWRADVLHCNDWPTALAPAYLALGLPAPAASLVVVHNLAFQGIFPLDCAGLLGLPPHSLSPDGVEYWGRLSLLKAGLFYADRIVTVSPGYAREALGDEFGCGMQGLLRARGTRFSGILNGIDTLLWDPRSDRHIARRYGADTLEAKRDNKRALQREWGLPLDDEVLVLGMVSRLTDQKGVDLMLAALPELFARPVQLVVLGTGEPALEQACRDSALRWPRQMTVVIGFDEALAHRIEAGADAFLMPSRFEPCGLNQLYSQRYGTPPIVRATGGLADSVDDYTPAALEAGAATGFVFADPTPAALLAAVDRTLDVYARPEAWQALCRSGMSRDFGWTASAREYLRLYEAMRARA